MQYSIDRSINFIDKTQVDIFIDWFDQKKCFIIDIDWKLTENKNILYKQFSKIIWFPDYFWNNWDAFWDIMTDEDFVNKDLIIIIRNYNKLFFWIKDWYEDQKILAKILLDLIQTELINTKIQIFFFID